MCRFLRSKYREDEKSYTNFTIYFKFLCWPFFPKQFQKCYIYIAFMYILRILNESSDSFSFSYSISFLIFYQQKYPPIYYLSAISTYFLCTKDTLHIYSAFNLSLKTFFLIPFKSQTPMILPPLHESDTSPLPSKTNFPTPTASAPT